MRFFPLFPLFVASMAMADSSGTYRPAKGEAVSWQVNQHHALIWGGAAYVPVGLRVAGTPEAVAAATASGAHDLLVELPLEADWTPTIAALEGTGARYLITISSSAPPAKGFLVDPQKYRAIGQKTPGPFSVKLPDATGAIVSVASARDNNLVHQDWVPIKDGTLEYNLRIPEDIEHVVYLYPLTQTLSQLDYWTAFDRHRDRLLVRLKSTSFGPGFRGIVNPLGEAVSLRSSTDMVIPTDPQFQLELRNSLEERYRNLSTAMRSWSLGVNSLESFDQLARLVPLWQGAKGTLQFFDPRTQSTIRCNSRNSTAWADIRRVIDAAAVRRFDRLVRSIKQVADVPIVQDWRGWAAPYEVAQPALSGVGFRASGNTVTAMIANGANAASSVNRWQIPGWLVASHVATSPELSASDAIAHLSALGTRAFYFSGAVDASILGQADATLSGWSPRPLFFPENALNPAAAMRLVGGRYWLPSPANGNVLDLGGPFRAYRYDGPSGKFVALWTREGSGRVKLRVAQPKGVLFETLDGSDPKPKYGKNSIEVTISPMPLLITGSDEVPVPEMAMAETVQRFETLAKLGDLQNREITQEKFNFKDAAAGFERNPWAAFDIMRNQYWRLTAKMAPFLWVEAESTRNNNFSEATAIPGCTGNAALILRSAFPGAFKAEYGLPVKTEEDITVWIAGRIPKDQLDDVTVNVAGQTLQITEEAGIIYGQNMTWYKMGVTQLKGTTFRLVLNVNGDRPHDLVIDAMLLAPSDYTPTGAYPPEIRLPGKS